MLPIKRVQEEGIPLELWLSTIIAVAGITIFGHFEEKTPVWKKGLKWAVYFSLAPLLSRTLGRPWSLVWVFGLPACGAGFHVWWCRKHGINALTAEPKEKYYELRGWS
jgi:hypothetical protein